MATMTANPKSARRPDAIPRAMRRRVEELLEENYAFMDSPIFRQRNLEKSLFAFEEREGVEPALPLTSWYQPTRDEAIDETMKHAPQLMKGAEEKLMFLRFNFCKRRLSKLQKTIKRDGLTRERAEAFLEWHR